MVTRDTGRECSGRGSEGGLCAEEGARHAKCGGQGGLGREATYAGARRQDRIKGPSGIWKSLEEWWRGDDGGEGV